MDLITPTIKVASSALPYVGRRIVHQRQLSTIKASASAALATDGRLNQFLESILPNQAEVLEGFFKSPQFSHLVTQAMIWAACEYDDDLASSLRTEIRESLRHTGSFSTESLFEATDALESLLQTAATSVEQFVSDRRESPVSVALRSRIAAASVRNGEFLSRVTSLSAYNQFSTKLRSIVQVLHGKLRLPSVVQGDMVNYNRLYVAPRLRTAKGVTSSLEELLYANPRIVLLGDPGAGKSTLAAKLAYDLATDQIAEARGQVPLMLVVRDHTTSIRTEHQTLLHYLEASCQRPYGIVPPPNCLDYLLLNGLATVIIDGVDELGASHFRNTFAQMVDAFSILYPLVKIVVTSRIVGYDEAPLSRAEFPPVEVASFTNQQVAQYANLWFGLDDERSHQRRPALATSFLRESIESSDLRANPLMLSLLCALYSSEGYIPRNRPAVYERCSELLFDTWDRSRGIEVPHQFKAFVRPAVQQLAWHLFTDPEARSAIPRSEIAEFLAKNFLATRYENPDEALQAAYDFLAFCAGRAWVLTDMGSDRTEPQYGFVHRTFLEYFAAGQLVKQKPDPRAVWSHLVKHVDDASWAVLSQMAVQILDRDHLDGADSLLKLALGRAAKLVSLRGRANVLTFACLCLGNVVPHSTTVREIANQAFEMACVPVEERRSEYLASGPYPASVSQIESRDAPLQALLELRSPENVNRISRALTDLVLSRSMEEKQGSSAALLGKHIMEAGSKTRGDVASRTLKMLHEYEMPPSIDEWHGLLREPIPTVVLKYGSRALFLWTKVCNTVYPPVAEILLNRAFTSSTAGLKTVRLSKQFEELYPAVSAFPIESNLRLQDGDWMHVLSMISIRKLLRFSPEARGTLIMIIAPLLRPEWAHRMVDTECILLANARKEKSPRRAKQVASRLRLPDAADSFLSEWMMQGHNSAKDDVESQGVDIGRKSQDTNS